MNPSEILFDGYFDTLKPEVTDEERLRAQSRIVELGSDAAGVGLVVIRRRLYQRVGNTIGPAYYKLKGINSLLNRNLVSYLSDLVVLFADVVATVGISACRQLNMALDHDDEDLVTLAGISLSHPALLNESNVDGLEDAHRRVQGTACRVALAYSLLRLGRPQWSRFWLPYFINPEFVGAILRQVDELPRDERVSALQPYFGLDRALLLIGLEIGSSSVVSSRCFSNWVPNRRVVPQPGRPGLPSQPFEP